MDFFVGANESRWFDQMQPYGVTSMSWGGARVDKYSRGRSFPSTYGQDEVRAIVEESFTMGRLPVDPNVGQCLMLIVVAAFKHSHTFLASGYLLCANFTGRANQWFSECVLW